MAKDKNKDNEEERSPLLVARYRRRITTMKKANEYAARDNILLAVQGYLDYLHTLADWYKVEEKDLRPTLFDKEKELTEMLLISQVYWGLSKAYDRNSKLSGECARCLEQFARFSIGFKYQYVNQQLVRKFIKKNIAYNPKLFKDIYVKLQVDSKKCYIATYLYGDDHHITNELRGFKKTIMNYKSGILFVDYYYTYSPHLVRLAKQSFATKILLNTILKPVVFLAYQVIKVTKKYVRNY